MPAARPTTARSKPARHPGEVIRGAEVFASGNYRGKAYTVGDLERMAENFTALPYLDPPAVLGHEEEQEFLERTDLPAAGWVQRLWVEKYYEPATRRTEAILKADIDGVAPQVARLIRAKRYKKISAEVYDDFRDDFGRTHGRALRRVAFLGAEVPQVKRIADIPMPTAFAEAGTPRTPLSRRRSPLRPLSASRTDRGTYLCFAEPTPMDRQQMISAILAAMPAIQPATLDAMSDDQLADIAKNLPGGAGTATAAPAPAAGGAGGAMPFAEGDEPPPADGGDPIDAMGREELLEALAAAGEDPAGLEGMTDEDLKELLRGINAEPPPPADGQAVETMGDPAVMSREELLAELTAAGQDPAQLEGLTDDDLKAMYAQVIGAAAPAAPAAPAPAQPVAAMSEEMRRFSKLVTDSTAEIRRNLEKSRRQEMATRRQKIASFAELLVRQGRITPGEKPLTVRNLLRCDDSNPVVRFSDAKGHVRSGTVLDQEMDAYRRKPVVVKFGEKLARAGVSGSTDKAGADRRDQNAVVKFAEETFRDQPEMKKQFIDGFAELKKKQPDLTAVQYGVPPHKVR